MTAGGTVPVARGRGLGNVVALAPPGELTGHLDGWTLHLRVIGPFDRKGRAPGARWAFGP